MQQLLIIEDEAKTADSIRQGLEEYLYAVDVAYDGLTGMEMARGKNYDLIISDLILPKMNGLDICRTLRSESIGSPILMLTALGSTDDKVSGLDAGADDYLVKPFEFRELLARVRALLKRSQYAAEAARILHIADLQLNLDNKKATRAGKTIDLTAKEFALLEYLLKNKGRVLSKSDIADRVWGINFDTGTNVVEVYVNYLRKKIDRDFTTKLIHTQFGMGYVMKEE